MDKVKIKRVKRQKRTSTAREKVLAGFAVGSGLAGIGGLAGSAQAQKPFVRTMQPGTSEKSNTFFKDFWQKTFGAQAAQAAGLGDLAGMPFKDDKGNIFLVNVDGSITKVNASNPGSPAGVYDTFVLNSSGTGFVSQANPEVTLLVGGNNQNNSNPPQQAGTTYQVSQPGNLPPNTAVTSVGEGKYFLGPDGGVYTQNPTTGEFVPATGNSFTSTVTGIGGKIGGAVTGIGSTVVGGIKTGVGAVVGGVKNIFGKGSGGDQSGPAIGDLDRSIATTDEHAGQNATSQASPQPDPSYVFGNGPESLAPDSGTPPVGMVNVTLPDGTTLTLKDNQNSTYTDPTNGNVYMDYEIKSKTDSSGTTQIFDQQSGMWVTPPPAATDNNNPTDGVDPNFNFNFVPDPSAPANPSNGQNWTDPDGQKWTYVDDGQGSGYWDRGATSIAGSSANPTNTGPAIATNDLNINQYGFVDPGASASESSATPADSGTQTVSLDEFGGTGGIPNVTDPTSPAQATGQTDNSNGTNQNSNGTSTGLTNNQGQTIDSNGNIIIDSDGVPENIGPASPAPGSTTTGTPADSTGVNNDENDKTGDNGAPAGTNNDTNINLGQAESSVVGGTVDNSGSESDFSGTQMPDASDPGSGASEEPNGGASGFGDEQKYAGGGGGMEIPVEDEGEDAY